MLSVGHEQRGAGRRRDRRERAGQPRGSAGGRARRRGRTGPPRARGAPGPRTGSRPSPRRRARATTAAAARSLERPERERQQHRDQPAQMAGALRHPVRRERERQPADERRARRQQDLSQPEVREASGREVRQQHQQVPREDRPEGGVERPERKPERPAAEVDPRARFRLERVRVAPRRAPVVELVADEPEVVDGLQVVAARRLAAEMASARAANCEPNAPAPATSRPARAAR